jgi:hypothetical protein
VPDHDLKQMSKNDLVREASRLRALLEQQMTAAPGIGDEVTVHGVTTTDGKPFVQVRAGEAAWQWTPAEARQHALLCLDAAVEAERDAATVAFFVETMEDEDGRERAAAGFLRERAAAGFLMAMREHRADWLEQLRSGT